MTRKQKTKGVGIVLSTLFLLMLIPVIGLAIDGTIAFLMRAKLSRAVDASALAAARAYSTVVDTNDVVPVAYRYFDANFPPGEWGSQTIQRTAVPAYNPVTRVRSVTVTASLEAPLYFMRMLNHNTVHISVTGAAQRRDVNVILVIDRSGSVQRAGNDGVIKNTLQDFVANTPASPTPGHSIFVNGSDVVGLVSYGGSWKLDYAPNRNFRTTSPDISAAITNIPFGNNSTNTVEGLHQAYQQLVNIPNTVVNGDTTRALNVIILLTDGRPSAFTVSMDIASTCLIKGTKTGFISTPLGWPPATTGLTFGLFNPLYTALDGTYGDAGTINMDALSSAGCQYAFGGSRPGANLYLDVNSFPQTDMHGNSTEGPVYSLPSRAINNPQAIRYASYNTADNQATTIRSDQVLRPLLFVIGLNQPPPEEPLDADWLARLANDANYKDRNGSSVFQSGQSEGMYFNVDAAGLSGAFQRIASEILHLSQ